MSDDEPAQPASPAPPAAEPPPESDWLSDYGGLIGIVFVLLIVGGAIFMIERMRHYAALGDCAFTHAPQCAALLDR